jgi:hypothetical protein
MEVFKTKVLRNILQKNNAWDEGRKRHLFSRHELPKLLIVNAIAIRMLTRHI